MDNTLGLYVLKGLTDLFKNAFTLVHTILYILGLFLQFDDPLEQIIPFEQF